MHLNSEKLNKMRIHMYIFFIVIGNNKVDNDLWTPTIEFLKMVPCNVSINRYTKHVAIIIVGKF
jgi:hypothetical protein